MLICAMKKDPEWLEKLFKGEIEPPPNSTLYSFELPDNWDDMNCEEQGNFLDEQKRLYEERKALEAKKAI